MTLNCLYSSQQVILKSSQIVTGHFVTIITTAYAFSYLQSWGRLLEALVSANHWLRVIETNLFLW